MAAGILLGLAIGTKQIAVWYIVAFAALAKAQRPIRARAVQTEGWAMGSLLAADWFR